MGTLVDFPLDLNAGGGILNNKRSKDEETKPHADSFELGLVFELAGGLGLWVCELSPARKRGFFVAGKRDQKRE